MNVLIVGFDGGTERIFREFNMPYTHALLNRNAAPKLEENLLNRGWVEILSGAHASECGAFYRRVLCNGTLGWGDYNFKDLLANNTITPIWKFAEQKSKRVGIMNIPTTFPAQQVNGFFVAATGAGLFKIEGIPEELCWPRSTATELKELDYRVDIRLTRDFHFKDLSDFVRQLSEMFAKRVDAYLSLARKHQIDFGFVACRCTNVLQYAVMYELERYFNNKQIGHQERIYYRSIWNQLLPEFYQTLDANLKRLVEELSPKHVILVSDHSNVPFLYKVDANYFLRNMGYQQGRMKPKRSKKYLLKMIVDRQFRNTLSSVNSFLYYQPVPQKTMAFGVSYINGIFINDKTRFGGPVRADDVEGLSIEIMEKFNDYPDSLRYNLSAELYRSRFLGAKWQDYLPDLRINYPDTMFFTDEALAFVRPNENFGPVEDVSKIIPMYTGVKGRHPLCCIDGDLASLIQNDDPNDLRLVHRVIRRYYSDLKK